MLRVIEVGYEYANAWQFVTDAMKQQNRHIIDMRPDAYSWRSQWQGETLEAAFPGRYHRTGEHFRRVTNGGDLLARGIRGLKTYLVKDGCELILLCPWSVDERIVDMLSEQVDGLEHVIYRSGKTKLEPITVAPIVAEPVALFEVPEPRQWRDI